MSAADSASLFHALHMPRETGNDCKAGLDRPV
jgi:hypothetical protein